MREVEAKNSARRGCDDGDAVHDVDELHIKANDIKTPVIGARLENKDWNGAICSSKNQRALAPSQ